ncbi:MAG TPA: hypothetical protein VJM46_02055 [Candidatus Saccharimonadales bacterium]|nr:hypothetical protein [Candidatus Saccharimonadales bacterium]
MSKSDEIWKVISQSTNSPRELIIEYVRELADEARLLPRDKREAKGDYSAVANKFPQTEGEGIANRISTALAMQEWINHETADDLEEIEEIAASLELNPEDRGLWQKLFGAVDVLRR